MQSSDPKSNSDDGSPFEMEYCWKVFCDSGVYHHFEVAAFSENIADYAIIDSDTGKPRRNLGLNYYLSFIDPLPVREFDLCLQFAKARKRPAHILMFGSGWIVSEAVKAVIEELEPNVHEFFRIRTVLKSGAPLPVNYYLFHICQKLDSVIVAESKPYVMTNRYDGGTRYESPMVDDQFTFDLAAVRGKHIWRERRFPSAAFVSSTMRAALEKAKINHLSYVVRVVVKFPWCN